MPPQSVSPSGKSEPTVGGQNPQRAVVTTTGGSLSSADVTVWQTLASKRADLDTMMWQTPALAMTAQAFLLTLALGPTTSRWGRLTSACLSLVLALSSMQLMAKHRWHEVLDSQLLERLERDIGICELLGGVSPHALPTLRPREDQELAFRRTLFRKPKHFWAESSFKIWMFGLVLFAIVGVFVIVLTILPGNAVHLLQ